MNPLLGGFVPGAGYLAAIRISFVNVRTGNSEMPIGLATIYESFKRFIEANLNRIQRPARVDQVRAYVMDRTIKTLAEEARLHVRQDALLTQAQKTEHLQWIAETEKEAGGLEDDFDQRAALADLILYRLN